MQQIPFNHTILHIATVAPDWKPYDESDKKFPPVIYHRPIAASLLQLGRGEDKVSISVTSKAISDLDKEASLTTAFFQKVPGDTSHLVTFNGRAFVLPVMTYSAIRHGIVAERYLQDHEVFTARFSPFHTDVSDFLSGYGAIYKGASLSEYVQLVGLAKRPYFDVAKAYSEGATKEIASRLELDVLLIAAIYFRMLLSQGRLELDQYRQVARDTMKTYYERSEFAKTYLDSAGVKEYLRAGQVGKGHDAKA